MAAAFFIISASISSTLIYTQQDPVNCQNVSVQCHGKHGSTTTSSTLTTTTTTALLSHTSTSSASYTTSSTKVTTTEASTTSYLSSTSSYTTTTTKSTTTSTTTTSTSLTTTTSRTTTSATSSSSSTTTKNQKQALIYMAGVNYDQAVKDYSTRGGITALGPQVYALDQKGNVFLADQSFSPSQFTPLAHSYGFQVIPLVMAGSGLCTGSQVWCSNAGIVAIITNSTQLSRFEQQLITLCQTYGFDGIQFDWETTLDSTYQPAMTSALSSIANTLHAMTPRRTLSITTYYWDYHAGPYNTWTLSQGPVDQLNLQAYTGTLSDFQTWVSSMIGGMQNISKLAIGMGDYSGVNPPIAGQCLQYMIQSGVTSVALWPSWGTEVSFGGYGYSDTVYGSTSYYSLFQYFLAH